MAQGIQQLSPESHFVRPTIGVVLAAAPDEVAEHLGEYEAEEEQTGCAGEHECDGNADDAQQRGPCSQADGCSVAQVAQTNADAGYTKHGKTHPLGNGERDGVTAEVMTEFMGEHAGEFVVGEVVHGKGGNDEQMSATGEGIEIVGIYHGEHEPGRLEAVGLGHLAPCRLKSSEFLCRRFAGSEHAHEHEPLHRPQEEHHAREQDDEGKGEEVDRGKDADGQPDHEYRHEPWREEHCQGGKCRERRRIDPPLTHMIIQPAPEPTSPMLSTSVRHHMLNFAAMLASLPSPSSGSLQIGPLRLNAYGAIIALGVVVAVVLSGRRFERRGIATREDASTIALWGVPAGVIGGRLYHVVTDWDRFRGDPWKAIEVWKGGLGIWGGIALGVLTGAVVAKRKSIPVAAALTCVAPPIAFAQAIGRWGNWFNQELFGRATTLPWGLEIDDRHLPAGFVSGTLFHPTFLYESIGCAVLGFALIVFDRRKPLRDGALFAWYVAGYTAMRFFIEGLRIDPARDVGGLRLNQWTSLVVFTVALGFIVKLRGVRVHGQILDDAQ